jgi:hypothetical protein
MESPKNEDLILIDGIDGIGGIDVEGHETLEVQQPTEVIAE